MIRTAHTLPRSTQVMEDHSTMTLLGISILQPPPIQVVSPYGTCSSMPYRLAIILLIDFSHQ